MPKANGKRKDAPGHAAGTEAAEAGRNQKPLYSLFPWTYRPVPGGMAVEAYVEAAGDWEMVAEIRQTAFIDAEITARFIAKAVNERERNRELVGDLAAALELCLKVPGLTWEAEHEAEIVLARAKGK